MMDYRESHLHPEKAKSYHGTFSNVPYRHMVWKFEKAILDRILTAFYRNSEIHHLDFACGTGRILAYLEDRADTSVGLDLSPSMLEIARKTIKNAEIIEADITKEDILQDRKFNLITAFRFFPNAQPELRKQAMIMLRSHLYDDGYLIFNNHKNAGSIRYRLSRILGWGAYGGMKLDEIKTLLSESYLEIVQTYHLCVLPASEKHTLLPISILSHIEARLSRCPLIGNIGENLIFLCRKYENTFEKGQHFKKKYS